METGHEKGGGPVRKKSFFEKKKGLELAQGGLQGKGIAVRGWGGGEGVCIEKKILLGIFTPKEEKRKLRTTLLRGKGMS